MNHIVLYDETTMTRQGMNQLDHECMEHEMLDFGRLAFYSDKFDHDIEIAMAQNPSCNCVYVPMR